MHGFMDFIFKFFPKRVQEILLVILAALLGFFFICSWPHRYMILRENLPREISMKWFMSFPSSGLVTGLMLAEDYNNSAGTYAKQGNFPKAINDYNEAIEIESNLASFYYNRGFSYTQATLYFNRGLLYVKEGNFALATLDFNKVIELKPEFFPAYGNLGIIYANQGKYAQAITVFTKAAVIDPNYAPAYYNLDKLYYQMKEYDKAWGNVLKAESLGVNIEPGFIKMLKRDSGRDK